MANFPYRTNATVENISTGMDELEKLGWATEMNHPTLPYLSLDKLKEIMRSDKFNRLPIETKKVYSGYATFLLNQQKAGSRGKSRGKSIKKRKSRRNRTGKKSIKKRRKSSRRRR